MSLYTFNLVKPLKKHLLSNSAENLITTVSGKAFLVGIVKVRILGIPFSITLQPEHLRSLAKGFYSRVDALAYAARLKRKGIEQGSFDLEKVKSEHTSATPVSAK